MLLTVSEPAGDVTTGAAISRPRERPWGRWWRSGLKVAADPLALTRRGAKEHQTGPSYASPAACACF
jgi:hypothetical protein